MLHVSTLRAVYKNLSSKSVTGKVILQDTLFLDQKQCFWQRDVKYECTVKHSFLPKPNAVYDG